MSFEPRIVRHDSPHEAPGPAPPGVDDLPGDDLPGELQALAEQLSDDAHRLARAYPAGDPAPGRRAAGRWRAWTAAAAILVAAGLGVTAMTVMNDARWFTGQGDSSLTAAAGHGDATARVASPAAPVAGSRVAGSRVAGSRVAESRVAESRVAGSRVGVLAVAESSRQEPEEPAVSVGSVPLEELSGPELEAVLDLIEDQEHLHASLSF